MKRKNIPNNSPKTPVNRGFAVLLILLGLMIVGGIVVLKAVNANPGALARQQVDTDILARAKLALLTSAIYDSTARPGNMLIPDYINSGTAVYDGKSNSGCQDVTKANGYPLIGGTPSVVKVNMRCLGRLPWKALNFDVSLNKDFSAADNQSDSFGEIPWYAVSANLVDSNCFGVLNSETLSAPAPAQAQPAGAPCSTTNPVHPWLTVHDASGKILSDQVAAVLILPGIALPSQNRPKTPPLANATQYLDALTVSDPAGCSAMPGTPAPPCVISNAGRTNHFVVGNASPTFNDRVIYITVQELAEQVQKRVAAELRASLTDYFGATKLYRPAPAPATPQKLSAYPWLIPLSAPITSEIGSANIILGRVPVMTSAITPTEFSWELTSPIESTTGSHAQCYKYASSPDRFIRNPLFNSLANPSLSTPLNFQTGSTGTVGAGMAGTCSWGNGALSNERTQLRCNYLTVTTISRNFDVYPDDDTCKASSGSISTKFFNVTRQINVSADFLSGSTCGMRSEVTSGTATDVARMSVDCAAKDTSTFISVEDIYTDTLSGLTFSLLVKPNGSLKAVRVSNMRFDPLVPPWFMDNNWHRQSMAAIAPNAAPVAPSPNPCGAVTTLSVGGSFGIPAVAIIPGGVLSGQTRPSSAVGDYLESLISNCVFAASNTARSASYNDTLLPLSP